jgi:hypothetical protein
MDKLADREETVVERIKRESKGFNRLNQEREDIERSKSLGAWARVASQFGGLTDREQATLNI